MNEDTELPYPQTVPNPMEPPMDTTTAGASTTVGLENIPTHVDPIVQELLKNQQLIMNRLLNNEEEHKSTNNLLVDKIMSMQTVSQASRTTKHKHTTPNKYKGERDANVIDRWIFSMDNYVTGTKMDEAEALSVAIMLLDEDALTWWQVIQKSKEVSTPSSWVAFKVLLNQEFRPRDAWYLARAKLETLVQRNSVSEYANEFRSLLMQAGDHLTQEEKVFKFVFHLKENTRKRVRDTNPVTLEEAVQAAERYDNIYHTSTSDGDRQGKFRFPNPRNFGNKPNFNRNNLTRPIPAGRPTPMDLDLVKTVNTTKQGRSCFNCGKEGHFARECPQPQTQTNVILHSTLSHATFSVIVPVNPEGGSRRKNYINYTIKVIDSEDNDCLIECFKHFKDVVYSNDSIRNMLQFRPGKKLGLQHVPKLEEIFEINVKVVEDVVYPEVNNRKKVKSTMTAKVLHGKGRNCILYYEDHFDVVLKCHRKMQNISDDAIEDVQEIEPHHYYFFDYETTYNPITLELEVYAFCLLKFNHYPNSGRPLPNHF